MASGPGPVAFLNANAVDTRATFTTAGTYVLRLGASDGALSTSATLIVTVQPATPPIAVDRRVATGTDDAEEGSSGSLALASSDLELVFDLSNQSVGMRFANIAIPRGATITRAWVQFTTKEVQTEATNLVIHAQAADNPGTFSFTDKVATRARTAAQATWAPLDWDLVGEAGVNQRTPDLAAVIQEVVNRPGWASGNALALVISGTGHRTAWAFEGKAASAPLLHIEASGGTPPPPTNAAPVVDAGPSQTITLPADAVLDGTVTDDGLPNPPGAVTTNWTQLSGPAALNFLNSSQVDTRATFTAAGTYVLRLTASDGALSSSDTVQVTVQPAPVTAVTVERRIATSSDDAEESATGTLLLGSSDLELVYDGSNQWVGMRFTGLAIPRGATIAKAYVQFEAKETQSEATSLTIRAQAADNPAVFSTTSLISTRTRTTAAATWAPVAWAVLNEAGANQRTPDLSAMIHEVVNRAGWASGNALVLVINGTGHRTAWSLEGKPASAPLLHIEYTTGAPAAPSARADRPAAETTPALGLPRADFALHRLSPNPSRGELRVEYSLADGRPATLEVLDLMGRRVVESDLGAPGPGHHVFQLRQALPPGLYAVRLVQGSQTRVLKAVVVR
jgi:hypothetical protein